MNVDTGKWMLSDQSKNILYVYNGGLFFYQVIISSLE